MKQKTRKQLREEEKKFKAILERVRENLIKQNEEYFNRHGFFKRSCQFGASGIL